MRPTKLEKLGDDRLRIDWSDGSTREYAVGELRASCPCATCREKRSAPPTPATELPILTQSETQPLRIDAMKPVGSYAYSIEFSDGHATGLFSLNSLQELGKPAPR